MWNARSGKCEVVGSKDNLKKSKEILEKWVKVRKVIQYVQYAWDSDSVFGDNTYGTLRKSKER